MRKRFTFWIDNEQAEALKAVKRRDGVPESEQIRRALAWWIEQKRIEIPTSQASLKKGK